VVRRGPSTQCYGTTYVWQDIRPWGTTGFLQPISLAFACGSVVPVAAPRTRLTLLFIGGALLITGAIWIVQGVGVLKGSFMTGQRLWTWIGAVAVAVGLVLIFTANGKRQPR
jgi:hypothetical protein